MLESKRSYFAKYFQNQLIDLKSTQRVIKRLISLKESPNTVPSSIIDNSQSATKPEGKVNTFKKYFAKNVASEK